MYTRIVLHVQNNYTLLAKLVNESRLVRALVELATTGLALHIYQYIASGSIASNIPLVSDDTRADGTSPCSPLGLRCDRSASRLPLQDGTDIALHTW